MRDLVILAVMLVLCIGPAQALADRESEQEQLALLLQELKNLEPLIEQAERNADPNARVQFQYQWLRADLEAIKQAIRDHMVAPHTKARRFEPLRGDYRR